MGDSFAHRYWSDFEQLAFEMTKDHLRITPTTMFRTQEKKDGGFDAVFVTDIAKLGEQVVSHEILMEAKLRSGQEALGLRAFAATLIIAFNGRTHCLVIVTNRDFSPQALDAARNFTCKSRLDVILVDRKTLSAWVRLRFEHLSQHYASELLSELLLPNPADEEATKVDISGGSDPEAPPPAVIESGRRRDGTLAKCQIILQPRITKIPEAELVLGGERRRLSQDLASALRGEAGCALVVGESGVGKSHIIRAALAALPDDRQYLGMIDLAQVATSRRLFLAVIAQLMGIDVAEVTRQLSVSVAKGVISRARDFVVPDDVTDAVLSVLASEKSNQEIDQIHLAEYLSYVAGGGRAGARLLVFHNLDKTTEEVLEFLRVIIPRLYAKDVSILVELTLVSMTQGIASSQWQAHVELLESTATLGRFSIPSLDTDCAVNLLLEHLPGLGVHRARFICERIGTRPLFLHHAALWLKRRHVVAERAQGVHLVEEPEVFFEGLRPEACVSILDRHIDLWRREIDFPYADAILAATLLNGRLSVDVVRLLAPVELAVERKLDALVRTGLFVAEPRFEGIRVGHSLLLERMIAIETGKIPGYASRGFDRKRVACVLLKEIETFTTKGVIRDLCQSALLSACEQWQEARTYARDAGKVLFREHQLAAAAEAFLRSSEAAAKLVDEGYPQGAVWRVQSLIDVLEVENSRYRLGLKDNTARLETLGVCVRTTLIPNAEMAETMLRMNYLRWRSAFTRENFDEALAIASDLFAYACKLQKIEPELGGRAVSCLGITLKAVERLDESKQAFEEAISCFPTSAFCRMEQLSNLAALALRKEPIRSLQYLRQILCEIGGSIPLLDRIHTEVDVAMALFLAHRAGESAAQAQRAAGLADANGIPAQGARSRNILGCLSWEEGRLEHAIPLLERAILDAERSYMERFLWRFRVNLATVAVEIGQKDKALANARWAEERLVKGRASRWLELAATPSHCTSRWYVGLLAVGLVYHHCQSAEDSCRLSSSVNQLPNFHQHLRDLVGGIFPLEVFEGTTHARGTRIMITG